MSFQYMGKMKIVLINEEEEFLLPSSLVPITVKLLKIRRNGYFLNPISALDVVFEIEQKRDLWRKHISQKALLYSTQLKLQKGERSFVYDYVKSIIYRYNTFVVDDEDDAIEAVASLTRLVLPPNVAFKMITSSPGFIVSLRPEKKAGRTVSLARLHVKAEVRESAPSKKYYSIIRKVYGEEEVNRTISGFLVPLVWHVLSLNIV